MGSGQRLFQTARCELASDLSATQLVIALKAWHDVRGGLPQRLDLLAPEFVAAVPADGFAGEPLHWALAERALYAPSEDERLRFELGF